MESIYRTAPSRRRNQPER